MYIINNGLKQGHALSALFVNMALEYVSRKAKIQPPTAIFHCNCHFNVTEMFTIYFTVNVPTCFWIMQII